ncbi:hypothetical protein FPZ24_13785 [Sphingomonas panacisoli]|uniref:DUF2178 domain-containing protein n=1 Tax=Sphingomonas panacisoli TaxID=1813879 RepID=A0A5B8LKG3_9SPHN|nr:hypothetical protein [Sphingomonas panacisoli]QDZ08409.1 hypothetical protein FPZ24_13785 [Sphingomonas panacisoli]
MTDAETADRLVHRRARMMPALAAMFVAQQASYFTGTRMDEGTRLVNYVAIAGFLALSIVLLVGLAGFDGFKSAQVRALTNDENTRANRADALRFGFLATMIAALALYVLSLFEPLGAREAIHVLMTAGIAVALLRFGMLERRALKDG